MTDTIWQSIPGAQPLHEIHGYWPTLHDALIRAIRVGYENRELILVLDSIEWEDESGKDDIHTRFTMRWHGVIESKLRIYNNHFYGVDFAYTADGIETQFTNCNFGCSGTILAAGIEVLDIGPVPKVDDNDSIYFEIEPAT